MAKTFDVIVAASYTLDLVFTGLAQFPQLGKDVIGTGFEMIPGGAYNSAIAMHRLGLKVGWAADFGNDDFSRFSLDYARREGLDDSLFAHHSRPLRRISVAASFPEDRAFITYYDPDPPIPAALRALATNSSCVLYVPGFYYNHLLDAGLALVRAKRMKLVMDGNSGDEPTLENPAVQKALRNADVFLPNAAEAKNISGAPDVEKALCILSELCPLVVVKDGPRGAFARQKGEIVHSPAISVDPVDTTGAGDCFNAGFLCAWLDGLPLIDCLRWGNIVGGLSTLDIGGTRHVVTRREVEDWLGRG